MAEVDTGNAAPDAAAAAATAAAAASAATPWHNGVDAETLGYIQNRGWHDKPANEAALAAVQAHREAAKLIGAPPEQLLRLPADKTNADAWKPVWEKLGAPADPKDYDFTPVKRADGTAPEAPVLDFVRGVAAQYHLSKDAAAGLAADLVKYQDGVTAASAAESTAALTTAKAALAASWGANFDANMFVAKQTALKLGVTPEQVAAVEKAVGYDKVMEMFRAIGQKTGEASFITNEGGFNNGIMTREQAVARKSELMNDTAWAKRYMDGGTVENRELQALLAIITAD